VTTLSDPSVRTSRTSRDGRVRGTGRALLAVALAVTVAGTLLAACGPTVTPTQAPDGSAPVPSASAGTGAVLVADKPPLAPDGAIDEAGLAHDSRDDAFRTPVGSVPAGTPVSLRIRATAGDLTAATVRVWDAGQELQALVPMQVVAIDRTAGDHGVDWWQATLRTPAKPTVLWYRFIVNDGPTTRYLEDDAAADGGAGEVYAESPDLSWQIVLHEPGFETPEWTHGATVYQVFPDRFFDGDPANNPSPDAAQGTDGAARFVYGDVYGNDVLPKAWGELPEGACRAWQGVACTEQPLGRDFFGGDLAGITTKLDDLAGLGVTVLYLNPVFAAPSNHRYDTSSHEFIDPDLGTMADFRALVAGAEQRGIRVLLDGVFNHVSSDSPWFDRERRFEEVGACEAAGSPYRTWFTFRDPKPDEPSPCAPTVKGGTDTYYNGWWGFDTIPEVVEQGDVYELFTGDDGVVGTWIKAGAAGWRLDVMDNLSHGFMRKIRDAAKAADPDAFVLGEKWDDASMYLLGDQADSVMNYRFRRAVIGLVNGDTGDLDGAIDGLTPSQFTEAMRSVQEDYPPAVFESLMNLVDSHDTTRILWTLTPGADTPADREAPANLAAGKAKLRLVAALQMTWPGMASVYYGTEAGLTGQDDPDDRRTYPWDGIDTGLRDWYRSLGQLRLRSEALRTGNLSFLPADDDKGLVAYVRRGTGQAAVVVLNLSDVPQAASLPLAGMIPEGATLNDALGDASVTVGPAPVIVEVPAKGVLVLFTEPGEDLQGPAAAGEATALPGPGIVNLSWQPVAGAAGYEVWRSIVSGGGRELVGKGTDTTFNDTTVRSGTRYFYVIRTVDDAGNLGEPSPEVSAVPRLELLDARLAGSASTTQELSAAPDSTIPAAVRATGTGTPGATIGIRAQVGIGSADGDPAADYAWADAAYAGDMDGADIFEGTVVPEAEGDYNVVLRVSTDDGATWQYADLKGIVTSDDGDWAYRPDWALTLTAVPGEDRTPPPAPSDPVVTTVTDASISLGWDPVEAEDLLRYEVLRGAAGTGQFLVVGTAVEPAFTDNTVAKGAEYAYRVRAVDTSFNRSGASPEASGSAQTRPVDVTFTVTLPPTTPAKETIFIAGDFQGWDPAGTPMTKVDDTHWSITLPFTEGEELEYKYARGSWEAVEKDDACGEIPNRTLSVAWSEGGGMAVADEVAKWRDLDQCP
jgi:glycosidase